MTEPTGYPEGAERLVNPQNTVGEFDWTQIEPHHVFTADTQSVLMDVGYLLEFAEAIRANQPGEFAQVHLCVTDDWPVWAVPVTAGDPDVAYSVAPRISDGESSPVDELREDEQDASDGDSDTDGDRDGDIRELAGYLNANGCEDGAELIKQYAEDYL